MDMLHNMITTAWIPRPAICNSTVRARFARAATVGLRPAAAAGAAAIASPRLKLNPHPLERIEYEYRERAPDRSAYIAR